ncbi:NAD(P)-dependent oxidoreductase [Chelativorans intermedius]|uniref:NAD(P)-dependent oxidoreductase n=1 Tax=Chelativorans intermedius TaxID=515947 RepID=A0ABV6D4C8_9HYPH|nr:NAD(P)-dependent oxidoreductase [Chelativorans intermedius]MCT8997610.1 NAD(P)-dependent oxidoreductase [Chelativorans intermedius]
MTKPAIAFLGTGLMGAPMAANLLKAGFPVTVWNRTPQKAAALAPLGARIAASAPQAVGEAAFVITMLSDGAAVGAVLFEGGVAEAMGRQATLIDMSSIRPAEARDHATRLKALGIGHLDAPVSGGTKGAEAATLAIMAGGEEAVFETARPVLEAMGRPARVGPAGTGQLAKLANQAIVAVTIGAVAEAMLLLEAGGADPAAVRHALKGGFADSVILQQHGERMTTGNFAPGGPSRLQLKDLDNALEEAARAGLTLPLSEQMRARFRRFVEELGGAEKDHSGIYLELLDLNKRNPAP